MIKKLFRILSVPCCLLMMASCRPGPAVETAPADGAAMTVEYQWQRENMCDRGLSPQITLQGVPEGTVSFKVRLQDLQMPSYNHGGGEVDNDGSNVIGPGALKNYRGPCPPMGATHRYSMTVLALDAGRTVLARGEKTVPCNRSLMNES